MRVRSTPAAVLMLGWLVFLFIPMLTAAQTPPGFPDLPPEAPIDGGLGILALGGGTFAAWKLRRRLKPKD